MNKLKSKIVTGGAAALVAILIVVALYGVSWIVTCGNYQIDYYVFWIDI